MQARLNALLGSLWDRDAASRYPRYALRIARYAFVLGRDLLDGQLTMRAMSLVYTSLLSLVPLLALAFSVLKALGFHNSLQPLLLQVLRPLGSEAGPVSDTILVFVENIRVGVLGSLGVALLLYAVVSLIHKVEESFNYIWRVERTRRVSRRLGEYLAALTLGPVLVFAAFGMTGAVMRSTPVSFLVGYEPFGTLLYVLTQLAPYFLVIALFTFLYSFVPNTRVGWRAAAAGGVLAGVLWQTGAALFASFVVTSTNYNAIYSGFAIVIFLLIWLYLGWLILLIGCQLAFYVQHPEHLVPLRIPPSLSGRETEYLALMIMTLAGQRLLAGQPPCTLDELSRSLGIAPENLARVADQLVFHGLLAETGEDRRRLIPAVDLESLDLARLWRLARDGADPLQPGETPLARGVLQLLEDGETAFERQLHGISLRRWITAQQEMPPPPL